MLTFSRQLAKQVRSVFRRALQISASQADQVVWLVADDTGLRICAQSWRAIIEYHLPCTTMTCSIPVTMEALAACEGTKSDELVRVEKLDDETVALRWDDHSIPQSFQLDARKLQSDTPATLPEAWASNPPRLLAALSDAMKIVPTDATRDAINCVQLRPSAGRLAATDTHQLLIETGFTFPGVSDVLIPRTTLFSSRELAVDQPVDVGLTANHCVFRMGPWTDWLPIEKQGRYPRVEDIIPAADSAKTRLNLCAEDVSFLLEVIPRLPTETDQQGRITLDLNGHVAMLAKGSAEIGHFPLKGLRPHGWLIRRVRQTVARPLVGRTIRCFCGNVAESKSSDPQGVGLQTSQIEELARRGFVHRFPRPIRRTRSTDDTSFEPTFRKTWRRMAKSKANSTSETAARLELERNLRLTAAKLATTWIRKLASTSRSD